MERGRARLLFSLLMAGLFIVPLFIDAVASSAEVPPTVSCAGHPRNSEGYVTDGTPQCGMQWCVGTDTQKDACDAAMHGGFITTGRPQLDDTFCVGSLGQRLACLAARRHETIVQMLAPFQPQVHIAAGTPVPALDYAALAQCESTNTNATTGNGFWGYFQFTPDTWQSVTGLPGVASDYNYNTQVAAVAKLYSQRGTEPWPKCGWHLLN